MYFIYKTINFVFLYVLTVSINVFQNYYLIAYKKKISNNIYIELKISNKFNK